MNREARRAANRAAKQPRGLYRPEDAAEFLSLSRTALYALLKSGELSSVKIGSRRRVTAEALEDYVARLQAQEVA